MLTTIKVCIAHIFKNTPKENFKWGHARSVRLSWIRLCFVNTRELESERAVLDTMQLDASTIFKAFQSFY